MSKSIIQDMRYRKDLLKFADKSGVGHASRKNNKPCSTVHFWRSYWDEIRRPLHHPNQHIEEELPLIRNMHRRNQFFSFAQ